MAQNEANVETDTAASHNTMFSDCMEATLAALQDISTDVASLTLFKDKLAVLDLPTEFKLRLVGLVAHLQSNACQLQTCIFEVGRLVQHYAEEWTNKSAVLANLHSSYDQHQRQLEAAVKQLEKADGTVERHERERPLLLWERLFAKAMSIQQHRRRWQYLIHTFREKAARGEAMQFDSDSDDNDEDVDEGELTALYTKPRPNKGHRRPNLIRSIELRQQQQQSSSGDVGASSSEVHKLQQEVSRLHERLKKAEIRPVVALKGTQTSQELGAFTTATTASAGLPPPPSQQQHPVLASVQRAVEDFGQARDIGRSVLLWVNLVQGLDGCVPADCTLRIDLLQSGLGGAEMIKLRSELPPQHTILSDGQLSVGELLDLGCPDMADMLVVTMLGGGTGAKSKEFATGRLPMKVALSESIQSKTDRSVAGGIVIAAEVAVKFRVPLQPTRALLDYRRETGAPSSALDSLAVNLEIGTEPLPRWSRDSADNDAHIGGAARHQRVKQALEQEDEEQAAGDLFHLLDTNEADLADSTFSMQEMMDLALLHANQLSAMEDQHKQELRKLQSQITDLEIALENAEPDAPDARNRRIQTDPVPEPEARVQIVEKTVEKIVEKVVEKVVKVTEEVIVEVPVPVHVAATGDNGRRLPRYDPSRYASTLPKGFLRRLLYYTQRSIKRQKQLKERVEEERQRAVEGTIASKFLLEDTPETGDRKPPGGVKAAFMPSPTAGPGAQSRFARTSIAGRIGVHQVGGLRDSVSLPPIGQVTLSTTNLSDVAMASPVPYNPQSLSQTHAFRQRGVLPNGRPVHVAAPTERPRSVGGGRRRGGGKQSVSNTAIATSPDTGYFVKHNGNHPGNDEKTAPAPFNPPWVVRTMPIGQHQ